MGIKQCKDCIWHGVTDYTYAYEEQGCTHSMNCRHKQYYQRKWWKIWRPK